MSDLEKMREALHLLASTLFGPIKEDQTHYLRRLAFLGGDDLKVYAVKPTNDGGILTVKDARKIWEALQIEAARPEALAFQEAVWLLEVCRSCDLVYDGPWGPTGPDVHVIVDAFLKKHKSVIEGYAPQCPESPQLELCGCPGSCQGYATLSKGVTCAMHVPESIARPLA